METLSELEQPHTCTFHLLGCYVFRSDNTYLGPLNWLKDSVAIADNPFGVRFDHAFLVVYRDMDQTTMHAAASMLGIRIEDSLKAPRN